MAKKRTWREKLRDGREPHVVVLEKPYAGVPAGKRLLISSPGEIAEYVATVPPGRKLAVTELRADLARRHSADATCPTTTSIFLRVVAEAALEEVAAGEPLAQVAPFWRVVDPGSPLARKLSCGPNLIRQQIEIELEGRGA